VDGSLASPPLVRLGGKVDPLAFTQAVESPTFHATRVEEKFSAGVRCDKTESAVADDAPDSALHELIAFFRGRPWTAPRSIG
jgi:hypothetical protein